MAAILRAQVILVTGASGLLGATLISLARDQGYGVVGVYHRHPVLIDGVRLLSADLEDQYEICRILDGVRPSSVVHCAAATNVDWCEAHPDKAHRVNVMMPSAIAEIAARNGIRLLHISTDSVFDGRSANYAETDVPAPVNVYARTKLQAEKEVLHRCPAATVARVSLYGWNAQNKESLAEWVLKQLMDGKQVSGFSDVIFCPMLANDLAEVLLALLDQNLPGIYHAVGSEAISKYEFARRVAAAFRFDPERVVPARLVDAGLKAQRPRNLSLNVEKIRAALGHSMPNVETGLRRFVQLHESGYADRIKGRLLGVQP